MGVSEKLRAFLKKFLYGDGLTCAACGAELFGEEPFCPSCLKSLPFHRGHICSKCGRDIGGDYPVCAECKADMPSYGRARSVFSYEKDAVRMIRAFKTGKKYFAEIFGAEMAKKAKEYFPDADLAVFIPMTARAEKKRGYNQAELLAEVVCRETGIPLGRDVLVKTRDTGEQKTLTRKERAENLRGSFRVHERTKCRGKKILIIDDVLTTGATANAAAEALLRAGTLRADVLTVACVPRKGEKEVK